LFFGGFVLAEAAAKSGLDRHVCRLVIGRCDSRPSLVLVGTMGITFVFSMFISNTATTSMMMAVIAPVVISLPKSQPFAKALLLGVPFAANLGGMGTVIGSPPNAIAVGVLQKGDAPVSFLKWSMVGLPPALLLIVVAYFYLMMRYPPRRRTVGFLGSDQTHGPGRPFTDLATTRGIRRVRGDDSPLDERTPAQGAHRRGIVRAHHRIYRDGRLERLRYP
jgi:di/tricarboxylate transporter